MAVKVKTKSFGEIEIDEKIIFDFPDGILGFDYIKKFVLLDSDGDNSPFKWLQAYDEVNLAFVIIMPIDFLDEYDLVISQNDLEAVGADDPNDLMVFAIVTIPADTSKMTANLQGPLILNPKKRLGRQAISLSDKYGVRHNILEELNKSSVKER